MGTQKSLDLDSFVHDRCYFKSETWTRTEITREITTAISNLTLVEYVSTLPTSNIKNNRLYIVPNNENPEINQNLYDVYIRYNNKWEQIDSLEFNIADYYTASEVETRLATKSNTNHRHNNAVANTSDGFISKEDQAKLNGIATGANKTTVDTTITASGTNPVQGKAIYTALAGKAAANHNHDTRYYTQDQIDNKLDAFIGEEGTLELQNYYKKDDVDDLISKTISNISIDDDLIMEIQYGINLSSTEEEVAESNTEEPEQEPNEEPGG